MTSGLLILAVFFIFASLMYLRVVPALLALPSMALAMAAIAGVPLHGADVPKPGDVIGLNSILIAGSVALAKVYVTVIFGAWLGRVTLDTGIAKRIVNFAAEYGGEQPLVLALVLCTAVALLFVSLSGLGAIIMVGSIVLPIMMTVGVPRRVAATLFLLAFALGFIFNIVQWTFYTKFFGVTQPQLQKFALVLALIDAVALVVYAVVAFRGARGIAAWAVRARESANAVPAWSLITPLLPIVFYYGFKLDPIVGFALSALYGALTTRPRRLVSTLIAAAIRGFEDVAPAVLLFMGIGMLLTATQAPQFAAALKPLVSSPALGSPITYVVLFGLLSPLVLYRGPLNPFGVGIAIFTALLAAHVLPPVIIVAAVMAVVQVQNVCDPTNTHNVWVGNYTGVGVNEITRRTLPFQVAVATAATLVVVLFARGLFGLHPFSTAVAAAPELPGLYAPSAAAYTIAVASTDTREAQLAARAVFADFGGWHGFRALERVKGEEPQSCAQQPFAALVQLDSERAQTLSGIDLDVGLTLFDCAGWNVSEWHAHRAFAAEPNADAIRQLALDDAMQMRIWSSAHPQMAAMLFGHGLAFDPQRGKPTYFYSLFKTVDGYMRAYVRPGGPAYAAGMRTNDIVDMFDGKFWWEYGTFQTQRRAYDGLPHTFSLTRGSQTIVVTLGAPYTREDARNAPN